VNPSSPARPEGVYAGDVAVLEEAASRLPRLRFP